MSKSKKAEGQEGDKNKKSRAAVAKFNPVKSFLRGFYWILMIMCFSLVGYLGLQLYATVHDGIEQQKHEQRRK